MISFFLRDVCCWICGEQYPYHWKREVAECQLLIGCTCQFFALAICITVLYGKWILIERRTSTNYSLTKDCQARRTAPSANTNGTSD